MAVKNYAVSNRAKLLNITKQNEGLTYMQVLTRFIQERFLYRLSVSEFKDNFFLKGGALLYAHDRFKARPTLDMDFMGERISRDKDNIKSAFQAICRIDCPEDGVYFDSGDEQIELEDITLEREYNGIRVHLTAHMDTIKHNVSMDIGFGDIIIPEPVELDYPLLIEGLPAVNIGAYSLETVVAEKFQTMIDRAESNSRMKDFFDVYGILSKERVDKVLLEEAIREVFANRGTVYTPAHPLFSPGFESEPARLTMWTGFLGKIHYKNELPFELVVTTIREELGPIWDSLNKPA